MLKFFLIKLQVYPVNLPIQSECRKIRTRKNSVFGLRSAIAALFFHFYTPRKWASIDELYLKVKLEAQPFTGVLPNSCCKNIFGIRKKSLLMETVLREVFGLQCY